MADSKGAMQTANMTSYTNVTARDFNPVMTRQLAAHLLFIFIEVLIPIVACCGIMGNIFSICVLIRDGLDKSYNILLISLAYSDTSFLTPLVISAWVALGGFEFPTERGSFGFIFYRILVFFDYSGAYVSITLPIFITFERLVVIFFPLSFSKLINKRSTLCTVICIFAFMYGVMLQDIIEAGMYANYENVTVYDGLIGLSVQRNSMDVSKVKVLITRAIMGPFPISFVVLGCFVLGVKLKLASIQRKKMTNKAKNDQANTSRVTLTLMMVCFVYSLTSLWAYLLYSYFMQPDFAKEKVNEMLVIFLAELNNMVAVINCSVNFLIYVFINQKFRDIFLDMMRSAVKKKT